MAPLRLRARAVEGTAERALEGTAEGASGTAGGLRPSLLPVEPLLRQGERRTLGCVLLVASLLMAAAWLAPEQPQAQADICLRHNGVAACRVW